MERLRTPGSYVTGTVAGLPIVAVRDESGSLMDMSTYQVTAYGIYSSHMAQAGKAENSAYDVSGATVTEHAVHHFHGLILDAYRRHLEQRP
ncbi:hypothetical protein ABZ815_01445 [Nonomuraea sp. NPDC047529]|uniref:hypothetical protein n=1 Tax=Nonomuraea sp. NPDC047529 TaxID=3155623 RepID=UPI0033C0A154